MPSPPRPTKQLRLHAENCIECGLCVRECSFLQQYGSPKAIAASWQRDSPFSLSGQQLPFFCNLCGLCTAVCPPKVGLDPAAMFLEMRQQIVASRAAPFPEHRRLLAYEERGVSDRYSWFALPENCDTVLFPGCAFAGTRPTRLLELFEHLRQGIPSLGMVLGCCTKPSHDLGRTDFFQSKFEELRQALVQQGVRRVLVLCPSCHAIFKQYGSPLATEYVYTLLADQSLPEKYVTDVTDGSRRRVTVHDPCAARQDIEVHASVRKILNAALLKVEEMPHHGRKTVCCGEGGAVPFLRKDLARQWGDIRQQEAEGALTVPLTVTYCAGCVDFLKPRMRIVHLLDLLFAPETTLAGRAKIARAPFTYLNRLLLKRRLKKMLSRTRR